jgi:hypothetical protein
MINKEIFKLEKGQEDFTKMFYDGKVIKCLVAPYHTAEYFEKNLEWSDNVYVFPENSVPRGQLSLLIGMIVASPKQETIIITTSNEIITQMIGDNVRVFTEAGNIVPCPIKCLMANIHDIKYNLLENKDFKDGKGNMVGNFGEGFVKSLIDKINTTETSKDNYDLFKSRIQLVGEDVIRVALMNTLDSKYARYDV